MKTTDRVPSAATIAKMTDDETGALTERAMAEQWTQDEIGRLVRNIRIACDLQREEAGALQH